MLFGFSCTLFLHVLPLFLSLVHNGRWTCCMRQRRGLLACRGCSVYVVSRACARVRVCVYKGRGGHGVHLRGLRCGMSAAGACLADDVPEAVAGLTCAGMVSTGGGCLCLRWAAGLSCFGGSVPQMGGGAVYLWRRPRWCESEGGGACPLRGCIFGFFFCIC